jgi:hypothetical protein
MTGGSHPPLPHTRTNTHSHTHKQTLSHSHSVIHTDTVTHIQIFSHIHRESHTQSHTNTHTQSHTHTVTHKHTHRHTHTHTHRHTHTHTCVFRQAPLILLFLFPQNEGNEIAFLSLLVQQSLPKRLKEAGTNYRGSAARKGSRGPNMFAYIFGFSVVAICVYCTN